ncbi:transferase family-domain-containing protein [Phyllosticta capitalensis]
MGSIAPNFAPQNLPTETIFPKGWIRYLYTFELPEDYDINAVADIFRRGYQAAKKRSPILGSEAVPDFASKPPGMWKLREYGDEIEDFTVKDLRNDANFPSFSELKHKHFPAASFRAEDLCPHGVWPVPGERMPVTFVRPNFIRGGVIVSWLIFHAWADCTTIYEWAKLWAEECRWAQGIPTADPIQLHWTDREKVLKSTGKHPGVFEEHPEFTHLPFTPTELPPNLAEDNHLGEVFYFSPESIKKLKAEASPENAKITPKSERTEWISTADAMAALIWRSVMSAQFDVDTIEGNPQSMLAETLDMRRRIHLPIHPQTLGNFWSLSHTTFDLRTLLTEASLADLAIAIRRTLEHDNRPSAYDEISAMVEQLEDANRLALTTFLNVPGHGCIFTTWVDYPWYDLDWGTALGKVQSMRLPVTGMLQCLEAVFPRLPDGGLEVYVGVEKTRLDRLRQDPEWRRFAELR